MAGVEALKIALDSSVRIEALDLDGPFHLPVRRCGLALCFGILYHLKNPYGVLETLAASANYCLLSTAITRFAPDQQTEVNHLPVAFLAGRDGLRGDETNYWIFSETGLRTLIDRCRMGGLRLARRGRRRLRPVEHAARRASLLPAALARLRRRPRHSTGGWLAHPGERSLAMDEAALLPDRGPRRATAQSEGHRAAESRVAPHSHRARGRRRPRHPHPHPPRRFRMRPKRCRPAPKCSWSSKSIEPSRPTPPTPASEPSSSRADGT